MDDNTAREVAEIDWKIDYEGGLGGFFAYAGSDLRSLYPRAPDEVVEHYRRAWLEYSLLEQLLNGYRLHPQVKTAAAQLAPEDVE